MYTLFISTFRELIEIALLKDGKMITKKEQISNRNHSIYTIPLIEEILKENEITTRDLNEIIVIDGPGSFTGVRLGITVAKMLAYTLNIKIKAISSIEALASGKNALKMIITITDPKGKYFGIFDNGKLINKLSYLSKADYENFINTNYKEYTELNDDKLDIEAIYNYSKNIETQNPHIVKARYIKGIEALMVNNYSKEDINQINILGTELNPNFEKLFHIGNLPENENIIIIKEKNKIKGFLHYSKIYECLEIQNIIVDKMWRNNGYASALLDNLIQNNKDAKKFF